MSFLSETSDDDWESLEDEEYEEIETVSFSSRGSENGRRSVTTNEMRRMGVRGYSSSSSSSYFKSSRRRRSRARDERMERNRHSQRSRSRERSSGSIVRRRVFLFWRRQREGGWRERSRVGIVRRRTDWHGQKRRKLRERWQAWIERRREKRAKGREETQAKRLEEVNDEYFRKCRAEEKVELEKVRRRPVETAKLDEIEVLVDHRQFKIPAVQSKMLRVEEEQYNALSSLADCQEYFNLDERPLSKCCEYCQIALDKFNPTAYGKSWPPQNFDHYSSQQDLKTSAENGCGLCAQFVMASSDLENLEGFHDSQSEVNIFVIEDDEGGCITFERKAEQNSYTVSLVIGAEAAVKITMAPAPRKASFYDASASTSINTRNSLPTIKMWLRRCAEFDSCLTARKHAAPTRLLFLGENGVRLCLSKELDECPDYATLSHCWGHLQFETLKSSNVDSFKEQVPLEALTKTFQDAIFVTRYLGFEYLWIDSLCIVQDDPADWDVEASLMSRVYGNSSINIAASGAVDGNAGLFFAREANWRCQVEVKDVLYDCYPKEIWSPWGHSPLSSRGWALQERLLPHRNIFFTQTQVFWNCDKSSFCESFPYHGPSSIELHSQMTSQFRVLTKANYQNVWREVVRAYSRSKLTLRKDKFVALSGVAQMIQSKVGDEYVAGLWRNSLASQLTWALTGGPEPRASPYVAPTWSWASFDKDVRLPEFYAGCIDVRSVDITYTSSSIFGEISDARLQIAGQLSHVTIQQEEGQNRSVTNYPFSVVMPSLFFRIYTDFDSIKPSVNDPMEVCLLPVNLSAWFGGLILERVRKERGLYRRLGRFRFEDNQTRDTYEKTFEGDGFILNNSDCFEMLRDAAGKRSYVITII